LVVSLSDYYAFVIDDVVKLLGEVTSSIIRIENLDPFDAALFVVLTSYIRKEGFEFLSFIMIEVGVETYDYWRLLERLKARLLFRLVYACQEISQ
jgi:hypothetical protein